MGRGTYAFSLSLCGESFLIPIACCKHCQHEVYFIRFGKTYFVEKVALCVNTEILNEYEEILANKMTREIAHNVVETIARLHTTIYQEIYIHFGLIEQDVDDNKFVDCAVAADAEYIVTNDSHFNILKEIDWPKVAVVTIKEFAQQLADE